MKVLIIDQMHLSLMPMLESVGIIYEYAPEITKEEILAKIFDYEGVIVRSKMILDKIFFEKATKLKFIARAGSGIDGIDLEEVKKLNIQVLNAPEGNRDAVAEHTIGLILTLFNRINFANAQIHNYVWEREQNRGLELMGKVFAIIGFGNVGKSLAQKLSGFGVEILTYDQNQDNQRDNNQNNFTENQKDNQLKNYKQSSLTEIFERADIVSFHVSLNEKSHNMANDLFFNNFKKNIFVINTSRGEVLPLSTLLKYLQNGKILGVCLDVLENEKLKTLSTTQKSTFEALLALENVIFTPHVAGWTQESYIRINEVLVKKICNLFSYQS